MLEAIFSSFPLKISDDMKVGYVDKAIENIEIAINHASQFNLTNLRFGDLDNIVDLTNLQHFPISKNQNIIEFLEHINQLIRDSPEILIFDLDGTLYRKELGSHNNLQGSKLDIAAAVIYIKLFEQYLGLNSEEALAKYKEVFELQARGKNTLSQFLADETGQTRDSIIAQVWNEINPEEIITKEYSKHLKEVIMNIKQRGKIVYLLTAAPRVWMKKTIEYLELGECFEDWPIYTLENFGNSKAEIFSQIQIKHQIAPQRILSVGDNNDTDILPASSLEMKTCLVKDPQDLATLEFWTNCF
ncbi:MAG: HAD family hydrolase [bacterium]